MGNNKNLMEGMEGVELSEEEKQIARETFLVEYENKIKDFERMEFEANQRLANIQNEIDAHYREREVKVHALEVEASNLFQEARATFTKASSLESSFNKDIAQLNNEQDRFDKYRQEIESELQKRAEELNKRDEDLSRLKTKLDMRLENIIQRETILHE